LAVLFGSLLTTIYGLLSQPAEIRHLGAPLALSFTPGKLSRSLASATDQGE
jgi:hypothetical protein